MGGGNDTILDVLAQNNLRPEIYVAHDLDKDNRALIDTGQLSFVLHHDLSIDLQNVFKTFMKHHRLMADTPISTVSNIQVVTPENIPPYSQRF
jgi:LacI family transcriptional regulator